MALTLDNLDFKQLSLRARDYLLEWKDNVSVPKILLVSKYVLSAVAVAMLGGLVATVVEREVLYLPHQEARHMPQGEKTKEKLVRFDDLKPIMDQNVFRAEVSSENDIDMEEVAESSASLKQVLSNLTLLGVYMGVKQFCILQDNKEKKEGIFGIDEEIFDTKAVLVRIEHTPESPKVFIRVGGEVGELTYKLDEKDRKGPPERPTPVAKKGPDRKKPPRPGKPDADSSKKYTTNGKDYYISSAEVDSELNDFSRLLNQARVVPYFKDGKHEGYQIKAIDKGSLYEKLGLKNYDIIKQINGNEIDSPEKAFSLLKMLRNESEISLNIIRKGKPDSFTYHIN